MLLDILSFLATFSSTPYRQNVRKEQWLVQLLVHIDKWDKKAQREHYHKSCVLPQAHCVVQQHFGMEMPPHV